MGSSDAVDPLVTNALDDTAALTKKLGAELLEKNQASHESFAQHAGEILARYGWPILEGSIRVFLRVSGVPLPAAIGSTP